MGFIYNGINSKNMKIKARLTSWQASPALRNTYEVVPKSIPIKFTKSLAHFPYFPHIAYKVRAGF
jgi:hypothetical protein